MHLPQAEAGFVPLGFDAPGAGRLRLAASGWPHNNGERVRAMIAASALSPDLPAHPCNPHDFSGLDDLTVVAVPHPDL